MLEGGGFAKVLKHGFPVGTSRARKERVAEPGFGCWICQGTQAWIPSWYLPGTERVAEPGLECRVCLTRVIAMWGHC
jgi:hypothetical protein